MAIIGIAFPFRKGPRALQMSSLDDDVIRDNIVRILQTKRGSRVMRPDSGSDTWSFVFENIGSVLDARIDHEVRRAVAYGEPRARVLNVGVGKEDRHDGGVNVIVTITYSVGLDVRVVAVVFPVAPGAGP